MIIAKITDRKERKFSVVDLRIERFNEEELRFDKIETSCLSYQVEDHLMKYYDALLVSLEEYDEYLDPFLPTIEKKEKDEEDARREWIIREESRRELVSWQKDLQEKKRYLAWLEDFISDHVMYAKGYQGFKKAWYLHHNGGRDDRSQTLDSGKGTPVDPNGKHYISDEPLDHGHPLNSKPRSGIVLSDEEYANQLLKEARKGIETIERLLERKA